MTEKHGLRNLGYCGVDCSVCADYLRGRCPSCRGTHWTEDDICHPVKCCLERKLEVCGQCGEFPCGLMRDFYEESDSHREAGERMRRVRTDQN